MEDRKLSCLRASSDDSGAGDSGDAATTCIFPLSPTPLLLSRVIGERQIREKALVSVKSRKRIQRDSEGSNDEGSFSLIRLKRRVVTAFYSTA